MDGQRSATTARRRALAARARRDLERARRDLERARSRATSEFDRACERFPVLVTLAVALERERASGGILLSGGLAYRLFFWLVPLGLVAAATASLFTSAHTPALERAAREHGLSAVAANAAQQAITSSTHARWYLLTLGLIATIWAGYGAVRALNIVFGLAWRQRPPKIRRPHLAGAGFTLAAVTISIAAATLSGAVSWIGLGTLVGTVTVVLGYAGAAVGVSLLLPHQSAPARALLPGALLLSAGGLAIHVVVATYLAPKLGRSTNTYGMLGAATVILLWLYLIARLITLSAFVNATIWEHRRTEAAPPLHGA